MYLKLLKNCNYIISLLVGQLANSVHFFSANILNQVINILLKLLQASSVITAYQCTKNAPT